MYASMICCVVSLVCAIGLVFLSLGIPLGAIMFLMLLMPLSVCVFRHVDVIVSVLSHSLSSLTATNWVTRTRTLSLRRKMIFHGKSMSCSSRSRPTRQQNWLSFASLQCCHHGRRRSRLLHQALLLCICSNKSKALLFFQLKSNKSKALLHLELLLDHPWVMMRDPRKLRGGLMW